MKKKSVKEPGEGRELLGMGKEAWGEKLEKIGKKGKEQSELQKQIEIKKKYYIVCFDLAYPVARNLAQISVP